MALARSRPISNGMKVSRAWLQEYFEKPLPSVVELSDAFTFHAFEVEGVDGDVLDLKVLPDRAGYALSHRGMAAELSAILNLPLRSDPLREALPEWPKTDMLVMNTDSAYVVRHTGALYKGVKVGPSPEWLIKALESVGQRSINNIVDASNYVMLNIGQPTHAFDADKILKDGDRLIIDIREARPGEKIKILSGEDLTLSKGMYVIADGTSGEALDVAGVKGGFSTGITEGSTNLFISAGNYDGTLIRRMSQNLKLFTDASQRFQNRPSPELTTYGMRELLSLIKDVAGGELVGVFDVFPHRSHPPTVSVTISEIKILLGSDPSEIEISNAFYRLRLPFEREGDTFLVTPTFERTDLLIKEDLIEEVGRIIGYDKVESKVFSESDTVVDQGRYHGIERIKDFLVGHGFIEISTQSFSKKGDIGLANPLDDSNPFLRPNLAGNMVKAMKQAKNYAPLVSPPNEKPKLFEIGNIFPKGGERLSLVVSEMVEGLEDELGVKPDENDRIFEYDLSKVDLESYGKDFRPKRYVSGAFKPFSMYPFVLRDIAVWVPEGVQSGLIYQTVVDTAGPLLLKCELFDTFSKDGKTSYAFRLVFQSMDKTLTDDEVNGHMKSVTETLNAKEGWKVR